MAVNLFDANFYRSVNPDLAGLNDAQALNHLLAFGLNEGRTFSPIVDMKVYRENNPDLVAAGLTTNRQLYDHLSAFGVAEGRRFSAAFHPPFYRQANPDLISLNNEQLFDHFRNFGLNEGRASSEFLDVSFYLSANPDLFSAFGFDFQQALQHFVFSGLQEGRSAIPPTPGSSVGFADIALSFFDSGAGPFTGPYGRIDTNGNGQQDPGEPEDGPISLDVILGGEIGSSASYVSLPTNSSVTVGFVNETVVDRPGDDIAVAEFGAAGEEADVFVSSNLADFTFVGTAVGGDTTSFDLASSGFAGPVKAVKILSLNNGGTSPGFDVVNVQALPGSILF
jgi:hypothetical protein